VQWSHSPRVAKLLRFVRSGELTYLNGRREIEHEISIYADRIDDRAKQLARDAVAAIERAEAGAIDRATFRDELARLLAEDREARRTAAPE
jgi:hypothetical protein